MIKAILLDFESILVRSGANRITEALLSELCARFSENRVDPVALQLAIDNALRDPDRFLEQTNFQLICQVAAWLLNTEPSDVHIALSELHQRELDAIYACDEPSSAAYSLLSNLMRSEYAVVLVVNPLHPVPTIKERLRRIGFPPDIADYGFVTHSEEIHFDKSNSAFFAEIIARVGIEPDEALFCGQDIGVAQKLGIPTYQLSSAEISVGELQKLNRILRGSPPPIMTLHSEMIEPQYLGNIGALFGTLEQVKPHQWNQHPDPNEWSVLQIVCHLVESENLVQRPRLERIRDEDNPFIAQPPPPKGPSDFICEGLGMDYARQFLATRMQTINLLRALQPSDWNRPARHSLFGPTTLLEMAQFTAQHDRLHLNQLCQTLGKCS